MTINTTALTELPQDGNVSHLMCAAEDCSSPDTTTGTTTEVPANSGLTATDPTAEDDLCNDHLPQSFVPVAAPSMTEQEAVQQSVRQRQSSSSSHAALMWPSIGGVPLNEFTTEGYSTCAFPTLFPTGAGDFLGQHQVQVTTSSA